jgi:DNA polymerase (family X)
MFTRAYLRPIIAALTKKLKLRPVGSWRRGKKKMRDLDFITYTKLYRIVPVLNKIKGVRRIEPFSDPKRRKLSFSFKRVHIDIFYVKREERIYALLQYTGSKTFNIAMRAHAKRKGYKLNQYGLFRGAQKVKVRNERHLFKILKFPYHTPQEREI